MECLCLPHTDARAHPVLRDTPHSLVRHLPGWEASLRAYVAAHPEVVVVDSIDRIRQLHNRATMLRPLQGAGITLQQVGVRCAWCVVCCRGSSSVGVGHSTQPVRSCV
jgi:hypothetical protein